MIVYDKQKFNEYISLLAKLGSLTKLFSNSANAYLDSRLAENIYCYKFNARNVARDDNTVDAIYYSTGVAIKTFLASSKLQKIAEFNKNSPEIKKQLEKDIVSAVEYIAHLRNRRIESTAEIYKIPENNMVYHCIVRDKESFIIIEEPLHKIKKEEIKSINKRSENSIEFSDKFGEYIFNVSKSVLMKKFFSSKTIVVATVNFEIINNPIDLIESIINIPINSQIITFKPYVILPLYSVGKNKTKYVPERSGLNQWNAGGRQRDIDEVYIRIPAIVKNKFPDFFPDRNTPFELILPTEEIISAKVCQDNDKALMSNPNKILGKWILRDILKIPQGQLVTYEKLAEIGIDSVIVWKEGNLKYRIDFREIGAYEEFETKILKGRDILLSSL